MDHGAIVDVENKWGQSPLHASSQGIPYSDWARFKDIVRLLLERGAYANARDEDNATALHLASSGYGLPIVLVLLNGGANASAKDNSGQTPLHRLLTNGHYDEKACLPFVRLLLKHGVDVNAEDEDHATALHLVFDNQMLEVAQVLLDHGANSNGANPNAEDNQGETSLHRLLNRNYFREDHLDTVQLLLEHGANPNAKDKDGITPSHLTFHNGMLEVAGLLRKHGAEDAENDQVRTPFHAVPVS